MSQEAIAELEKNGSYTFQLDGADAVVEAADVEIFSEDIPGWLVANEGKLTVALEVTVTDELKREGILPTEPCSEAMNFRMFVMSF